MDERPAVNWFRRSLLEFWAIFLIAAIVGFLGPFGTYLQSSLADRVGQWWMLLMGAYVFVRPWIFALSWVATATALPSRIVVLWGVIATSVPLAMLWRAVGQDAYRELNGYSGLLPFSLLCALAVLGTERWAATANERIEMHRRLQEQAVLAPVEAAPLRETPKKPEGIGIPQLHSRLGASFEGPIIALQSEDHYVRVYGPKGNELILIRLRDAITEMEGVAGMQVHRSWWVAFDGIAAVDQAGRNCSIRLRNGVDLPVARDSIQRLHDARLSPVSTEGFV